MTFVILHDSHYFFFCFHILLRINVICNKTHIHFSYFSLSYTSMIKWKRKKLLTEVITQPWLKEPRTMLQCKLVSSYYQGHQSESTPRVGRTSLDSWSIACKPDAIYFYYPHCHELEQICFPENAKSKQIYLKMK